MLFAKKDSLAATAVLSTFRHKPRQHTCSFSWSSKIVYLAKQNRQLC